MPYDTESKSRNVLASPLGEEGHEVAKGCTRVRMIMILDVDVTAERRHYNTHRPKRGNDLLHFARRSAQGAADWRSGPRWSILSVLCPVHPFPLRGTSPQGETRDMREKTASHILQVPFRRFPPLVAGATTFPPQAGALWMLSHGAMSLQESIERFILSPGWGGKGTRFVREQSDLRIV